MTLVYYAVVDDVGIVRGIRIQKTKMYTVPTNLILVNNPGLTPDQAVAFIDVLVWNGVNFIPYIEKEKIISKYDFIKRFTLAEMVAMETKAETDNVVDLIQKVLFNVSDKIDIGDPYLINLMDVLVSKNVITEERKATILG
jgi:hypothetical protein